MSQRHIIRRPAVETKTGLVSRTIDRLEKAGEFPQRVRLASNSVGWFSDEVDAWLDARPRGGVDAPARAIEARMARSGG